MISLLGSKLRYLRELHGLTQEGLAEQLGLKRQGHISNLEMGRKAPSLEMVVKISELFAVTTDYLLRDDIPVEAIPGKGNV